MMEEVIPQEIINAQQVGVSLEQPHLQDTGTIPEIIENAQQENIDTGTPVELPAVNVLNEVIDGVTMVDTTGAAIQEIVPDVTVNGDGSTHTVYGALA